MLSYSKEDPVSFLRSSPPTPQRITCICSTCVIGTGNCLIYLEIKINDKEKKLLYHCWNLGLDY